MKPIKLTIKGLNSFIEEQTIDFEKLTDRGLFGIFGPTGSGKSTILDGITLALYGEIARKSTNYINTNCNELSVSFKFQISGSVNHIYVVTRQFRRDKKTGNAKTHSAIIKEMTPNGEEVLAESATTVTKACKEILGLSLEDFTRTVVLPQGKFSEFLKLEGKQRREMLERLFNLQDYGDRLALRLSNQRNAENEKYNQLIGELNTYEDISEEKLNEQKDALNEVTQTLDKLKEKQAEVESRHKQGEEIWNLQKELREYSQREQVLLGQAERMKLEEERMKKGESAQKVNTLLAPYEQKSQELAKINEESIRSGEKLKVLSSQKEEIEMAFKKINQQKEEKLPELKSKGQQVKDLLEENKKVIKLERGDTEADPKDAGIGQILEGLIKIQKNIDAFKQKEAVSAAAISEIAEKISKNQKQEQEMKVDMSLRSKVEDGLRLVQDVTNKKQNYEKSLAGEQDLFSAKDELKRQLEALNKDLEKENEHLNSLLSKQEEQIKQIPISNEELLKMQEALTKAQEKWKRLKALELELAEFSAQDKELKAAFNLQNNQVEEKKSMVEQLRKQLDEVKLDYYAYTLREHLQEGSSCPVCGSTHHIEVKGAEDQTAQMKEIEERLRLEEKELESLQNELSELKAKLSANKLSMERIQKEKEPLEEQFKETSIEEQEMKLQTLTEALKTYENDKKEIEEKVNQLKEERNSLAAMTQQKQAIAEEKEKQLILLQEEKAKQSASLNETQDELEKLKAEVGAEDFIQISQEIREKDAAREKLSQMIKEENEKKEAALKEKEELQGKLSKYRESFGRGLTKLDEKQKNKQESLLKMGSRLKEVLEGEKEYGMDLTTSLEELRSFIQTHFNLKAELNGEMLYESVMGDERKAEDQEAAAKEIGLEEINGWAIQYPMISQELDELQTRLHKLIMAMADAVRRIESTFAETETKKNNITAEYEVLDRTCTQLQAKAQGLEEQLKKDLEGLNAKLEEEQLTKEEVKLYLLTAEEIATLKDNINQYRTDCAELAGAIRAAKDKLGERKIEAEEWNKLQTEKEDVMNEVAEVTKQHTNLTTIVKNIEDALVKLGKLREEKQKIDHQIAILNDLDKLFKGKKFVEFVATTRLKYVSLEASKKLKDITNGNYGLEVDEDGKFIIRDYKNGGAKRDASTLSGGETFLASLALALALSAEIQLKGTAPLELFFLDEGFGTLDDELLDVVMGSLEKIHHDKLKVGIISHVESIKNRVSVKLLLTPAESGRGGTKVRLERS